jgi:hypothetical protein
MGVKIGNQPVMICNPSLGKTGVGRVFEAWFGIVSARRRTTAGIRTRDLLIQTVSRSHETNLQVSFVNGMSNYTFCKDENLAGLLF